ncbi:pentapeptide repeat-containing protein [Bradyrhizobium sp. BR13661]|nr:pentapeptide repeat-containing protein [Bradyrhizobium sp. BR13661]MDH6263421.1 hypothetical protein [Bradyrhizobium sp. BR13661]
MKIEESLQAKVPNDTLHLAERCFASNLDSFSEQVRFLGLNPARDFKHADLSDVDFSNSDLRGFDFTGADLRGAFGVNVGWDGTTCFNDADADDSVFSYSLSKKKFFDAHPEYADRVERLRGEHWANVILTVEAMLRNDRNSGDAVKIAKAVFDESNSLTVKAEIPLYMSLAVDTKAEHKAFIYHTLAQFGAKPTAIIIRTICAWLRTLSERTRHRART